jgi:hypothetical protein
MMQVSPTAQPVVMPRVCARVPPFVAALSFLVLHQRLAILTYTSG